MVKLVELAPVREPAAEWERIEERIIATLKRLIYTPLIEALEFNPRSIINSASESLLAAIRSGRITYRDGKFRGRFNSRISKELRELGAVWKRKQGNFVLPIDEATIHLLRDIGDAEKIFQKHMANIDARLGELKAGHFSVPVSDIFDTALWKVQAQLHKSLEKAVIVSPKLTVKQNEEIAVEWEDNMNLWIQGWIPEHIRELRQTVKEAIYAGNRQESLVMGIRNLYGVAERKAKFLARQETNLLMAQFKQTRYMAAGVHEYKWGCVQMPHAKSPDAAARPGDVRYYHGILEGQIFRFDDPPVTNQNPERRNNPGQDYNCRCFARPVVRF